MAILKSNNRRKGKVNGPLESDGSLMDESPRPLVLVALKGLDG